MINRQKTLTVLSVSSPRNGQIKLPGLHGAVSEYRKLKLSKDMLPFQIRQLGLARLIRICFFKNNNRQKVQVKRAAIKLDTSSKERIENHLCEECFYTWHAEWLVFRLLLRLLFVCCGNWTRVKSGFSSDGFQPLWESQGRPLPVNAGGQVNVICKDGTDQANGKFYQ